MKSIKTIFAKETRYVWIKAGASTWSSLPTGVRVAMTAGLERISMQRKSITENSKISAMPPVEIVPQMWGTDDSSIDGRMNFVHAPDGVHVGVQVPAQTALCEDLKAIHAVLVHEFLHCFHFLLTEIVDRPEPIEILEDLDPHSREQDDAHLANPCDWFGEQDANSLIHHGTASPDDPIQETGRRYEGHFLYVTPSHIVKFTGKLVIEESALKRACELKARVEEP